MDNGLQYEIIGDHVEISGYIGDATELAIPARILGLPVISIGAEAFFCCSILTSIELPDSITSIGTNAFYGCVGLTNIVIPEGTTAISDGTFFNCSGLTDIVIPEGITSIGEHAFYRCDSLTSILIPDSVCLIGFEAFALCSNLLEIQVDEHNRHYSSDNRGVLFDKEKSLLLFAPRCDHGFL